MNKDKLLLDAKDIMRLLGVGRNTLQRLLNNESFPSFKIGSKWYIGRNDLNNWILNQREK